MTKNKNSESLDSFRQWRQLALFELPPTRAFSTVTPWRTSCKTAATTPSNPQLRTMKDLFSALLAPFFVIVNVVALFFLLAACPVVIAVAAIAAIVALPFVLLLNFFEADR